MKEVIIRFKSGEQIRFKCKDAKLTNTLVVKHDDGFIRTYFTGTMADIHIAVVGD